MAPQQNANSATIAPLMRSAGAGGAGEGTDIGLRVGEGRR